MLLQLGWPTLLAYPGPRDFLEHRRFRAKPGTVWMLGHPRFSCMTVQLLLLTRLFHLLSCIFPPNTSPNTTCTKPQHLLQGTNWQQGFLTKFFFKKEKIRALCMLLETIQQQQNWQRENCRQDPWVVNGVEELSAPETRLTLNSRHFEQEGGYWCWCVGRYPGVSLWKLSSGCFYVLREIWSNITSWA